MQVEARARGLQRAGARTVQKHPHAFEVAAALLSTGQDERRYIETSRHRVRIDSHFQQYLDAARRALDAHGAKELLEVFDGGRSFRMELLIALHEQMQAFRVPLVHDDAVLVQHHREACPRWAGGILWPVRVAPSPSIE